MVSKIQRKFSIPLCVKKSWKNVQEFYKRLVTLSKNFRKSPKIYKKLPGKFLENVGKIFKKF